MNATEQAAIPQDQAVPAQTAELDTSNTAAPNETADDRETPERVRVLAESRADHAAVDLDNGDEVRTDSVQPGSATPAEEGAEGQDDQADHEAILRRLASLAPFDYARQKKSAAKELGVNVSDLDDEIKRRRRQPEAELPGSPLDFREPERWPVEVDGGDLLNEIANTIRRFVVVSRSEARAIALWVIHTYTFDLRRCSPLLVLTSPTKRCGKTTALEIIRALANRPLATSSISPAALYRVIEAHHPTLLIDEFDTFFHASEALQGIVNSGHRRDAAFVIRSVGDDHEPRAFSTWAPKLLAGIGGLPDTVIDRSVVIELRRKLPSETVERGAGQFDGSTIKAKIARWVEDHRIAIANAEPEMPPALHDRAQDNWRPLFAIAEVAGPEWVRHAVEAAMSLAVRDAHDDSTGVLLLADIKGYFVSEGVTKSWTETLVEHLIKLEERSWGDYRNGRPISTALLSRRLADFGVESKTVRIGEETKKGFHRHQFEDAWQRYLPEASIKSPKSVTPSQAGAHASSEGDAAAQAVAAVTLPKRNLNHVSADFDEWNVAPAMRCDGVTDFDPRAIRMDEQDIPLPEQEKVEVEI